ncbi:MAG: hypothetical protein J7L58_06635 [Thermoplasmata archaeon]|nr:hypothetical protein [Thermoplasmata archaeon]
MKKILIALILLSFSFSAAAQQTYYYLHDTPNPAHEEYLLMDRTEPTSFSSAYINLDEGAAIWATEPFDKDVKINGDVKITVIVEAFFLKADLLPFQVKILKASLLDIAPSGNIDVIDATRPTSIIFLKNETLKPKTFYINNVERVIPAGHCLGIKIEKAFDLLSYFPFSVLSPFFATNIHYDSTYAKSYVVLPFNVSGGIDIECFDTEKEIKAGEEAIYTLLIYNKGNQNDTIKIYTDYQGDEWSVSIEKESLNVPAGSFGYTDVTVKAPENASKGDYLNITVYAEGKMGSDFIWLNTSIAPPEYGVKVTAYSDKIDVKPGETATVKFKVENTGDLYDTYSLFVTCVWDYTLEKDSISLQPGESANISVSVTIPENATNNTTRLLALTAKSTNSDKESTADVTLRVSFAPSPGGGGEESDLGKKIGYILFVAGVIALLVIAYYMGRTVQKLAIIECDERVAEAPPGGTAEFKIKVINPLEKTEKNKMRYHFRIEGRVPEKWIVDMDKEGATLEGGDEIDVALKVKIPDDASIDEWASFDFVVLPEKGKSERISLMVNVREPKEILNTEVKHEPEEFEEGERVVTKVRIENVGEKDAENKKVILYVNGKEKNRIEGVNIPAGGIVEIELPWIAEEENEVEVVVE